MHEHPGCIKAKEVYYSLGPRRTYRAVVKEMECYTHATISKWAKWFHWDDFVLSRDRGEYEGDLSVTAKLNQDAKELAASGNLETQIQQLIYKVDIALNGFFLRMNMVTLFQSLMSQVQMISEASSRH